MGKFGAVCRGIAETVVASFAAQVAVRGNAEFGCAGIAAAADADIQSFIRNKAVGVVDDRAVFTNVDTVFIDLDLILFALGHQNTVFTDNCFILFTISDNDRIAGIDFISVNTVSSDTGIAFDVSSIPVRLVDAAGIGTAATAARTAASCAVVFQRFYPLIQPANVHSVHFTAAQAHAADFTITAKNNAVDTADACHCACGKIYAAESSRRRFQVRCFQAVFSKTGCVFDYCFATVFYNVSAFDAAHVGGSHAILFQAVQTFRQCFDTDAAYTQTVSCVAADSDAVQIVRRYRACYQTGVIDMRTVSIGI